MRFPFSPQRSLVVQPRCFERCTIDATPRAASPQPPLMRFLGHGYQRDACRGCLGPGRASGKCCCGPWRSFAARRTRSRGPAWRKAICMTAQRCSTCARCSLAAFDDRAVCETEARPLYPSSGQQAQRRSSKSTKHCWLPETKSATTFLRLHTWRVGESVAGLVREGPARSQGRTGRRRLDYVP